MPRVAGGVPCSRGAPLRIPHHPSQRDHGPTALAWPSCSPEQAQQHPRVPGRGSRGSPPHVPWPGRGHIAPASRPSPGTCVSNVAGSSRESACSESSTKFLSDRVMGPSSLRGAGQGEGMLRPSRTGLEQGESQTKQSDSGRQQRGIPRYRPRARLWHSVLPDSPLAQPGWALLPAGLSPSPRPMQPQQQHPSPCTPSGPCRGDAVPTGTECQAPVTMGWSGRGRWSGWGRWSKASPMDGDGRGSLPGRDQSWRCV